MISLHSRILRCPTCSSLVFIQRTNLWYQTAFRAYLSCGFLESWGWLSRHGLARGLCWQCGSFNRSLHSSRSSGRGWCVSCLGPHWRQAKHVSHETSRCYSKLAIDSNGPDDAENITKLHPNSQNLIVGPILCVNCKPAGLITSHQRVLWDEYPREMCQLQKRFQPKSLRMTGIHADPFGIGPAVFQTFEALGTAPQPFGWSSHPETWLEVLNTRCLSLWFCQSP